MKSLCASDICASTKEPLQITILDCCDSTNTVLKALAKEHAPEGTILVTEHQTAGRGRLGKSFFSPKGCGLYFSILLRPAIPVQDAVFITVAAAVSIKRAVKKLLSLDTQIKWVNDVYFEHKKFGGILTETGLNTDGTLAYAILGIGINILPPEMGYPKEFASKTTNLSDMAKGDLPEDVKNQLLAQILNEFYDCYRELNKKEYLLEYKSSSCVIGKEIDILSGPYTGRAVALDIDENANLVVQLTNHETVTLSSGDVSIHI